MVGLIVYKCIVVVLSFAIVASQPKQATHPMLYFTSNEVPRLRHKAKTTHVKITKVIDEAGRSLKEDTSLYLPPESFEKFGSRWNELYGNNLCAFAMYCLLHPEDQEAFKIVKLYMDRMTSYKDWYVAVSRNVDQVPVAHSLTGYVTAFDFLYERFDETDRKKYLRKIGEETKRMYYIIEHKKSGWVNQHIHNHAPTNVLSVLLGAMVYEAHYPTQELLWKKTAINLLEKAMIIFSYIVDGSCDEGVAYGSYTSRGMTQYVYLAKRHFGIDHTSNPWLQEHFWFFFATTMPGYQRSVGIADSNHNWFYGPESQLVFLDAFVMKNGYGNWLAERIRSAKPKNPPLARSMSQRWSTVHTEFIFYDASIKSVQPIWPNNSSLHIFSDWGVVTYGGGQYLKKGNTFMSFKSSPIHGEAVADIVEQKLLSHFVNGWTNFNAGHEHADQNSFVFAPNGRYFITEALYAPKSTHLNNVLTFAPSPESKCNNPWEGQIGECSKWLFYKHIPVPRGKIVSVTTTKNLVYIAGEAVKSYRAELGLESVQRSLLLLHSEVLLVLDTIFLKPGSKLNRASAYFHNVLHQFHPYRRDGYQGAQVIYPEGPYAFFWVQPGGKSPSAQLQNQASDAEYKQRTTNFVNVTFPLRSEHVNRIAFLFVGPNVRVQNLSFLKQSNEEIAYLRLTINNVEQMISIASTTIPLSRRVKLLGFGGYATVQKNDVTTSLGIGGIPKVLDRCDVKDNFTSTRFVRNLITSHNLSIHDSSSSSEDELSTFSNYLIILLIFVTGVMMFYQLRKRIVARWKIVMFMLWMALSWYFLCTDCPAESERSTCSIKNPIETFQLGKFSTIIIVSFPGCGAEVLESLFDNSSDFLYLSSNDVTIPTAVNDPNKYHPCVWPKSDRYSVTAGWFKTMVTEPLLFFNNLGDGNARVERLRRRFRESKKTSRLVLNLSSGFWNTKLSWLNHVIGGQARFIIVVRDPRDWIYSLLRKDLAQKQTSRQVYLKEAFLSNITCQRPTSEPWEYHKLDSTDSVEKLAQIWTASVANMIRNGRSIRIVRFEDLVANPVASSISTSRSLGITLPVPNINRLARSVRSGKYFVDFDGPISPIYAQQWKEKLSENDRAIIEKVCGKLMLKLGYS